MDRQERMDQLEKLRVVKDDGRFALEKFRIESRIDRRSSACVVWRQILCSAAAGALFICSFSSAFAESFHLDLPKERLVPHKITPHLPPLGPFDQQLSKDLNDHSGESIQEKSSFPQSDKRETPKHSVEQQPGEKDSTQSTQLDDPYQSNANINANSAQQQKEVPSSAENSTMNGQRKEQSTPIHQSSIQEQTVNGAKLPQTATHAGSFFLQGLAIILLGCALWKKKGVN